MCELVHPPLLLAMKGAVHARIALRLRDPRRTGAAIIPSEMVCRLRARGSWRWVVTEVAPLARFERSLHAVCDRRFDQTGLRHARDKPMARGGQEGYPMLTGICH